jgi:hypothetical protein
MIKVAATAADVRKQKILDSVHGMQFAQDQYAQHFGISVDTQMAKIQGITCVFKIERFKNGGAL